MENTLLVEGLDDKHVIYALAKQYNLKKNFEVKNCEGIDKLFEKIPVYLKKSGIKAIGIVIDADTDLNKQTKKMKNILNNNGFGSSVNINKQGLIIQRLDKVKIGVWIMPNNETEGMLEDFIKFLVPEDDKLSPFIDSTLDKIESKGIVKFKKIHKSKAFIHTWLAWQKKPGVPMGTAITSRFLDPNVPECKYFIKWLKNLFT